MLRLCVDLDDIVVLCMTDCCITASHLLDHVACLRGTHMYPLISKSLVLVDLSFLIMCLIEDLLLLVCSSTELVTRSKV